MDDRASSATASYSCPHCHAEFETAVGGLNPSMGDVRCLHCGRWVWYLERRQGDLVVLAFVPGLLTGSESKCRLDEICQTIGPATGVVLNLAYLRFVSSMFLAMLVGLNRRIPPENGPLRICCLPDVTRQVFETTQLDRLFDIYDDEQSALASFA
jgi:anti-anti-sigma factor